MNARTRQIGILLVALASLPAPAAAQSPTATPAGASTEERAALLLYQSGKAAFKAGDHAAALTDFQRAEQLFSNRYVQFYLGMSLERLGRCTEALGYLRSLDGQLQADQESMRRGSLATCLLKDAESAAESGRCDVTNRLQAEMDWPLDETLSARKAGLAGLCETMAARRRADAGDCKGALVLLRDAPPAVDPRVRDAREALEADCRGKIAGFVPRNAREKAAWMLQEEGIALLDQGRAAEASARFEKALTVFPSPHIRRFAARARLVAQDCPGAQAHAAAAAKELPEAALEARRLAEWCDTFFLPAGQADAKLRAEVMAVTLRAALVADPDLDAIRGTLARVDDPRARLFLGRRYLDAGRYPPAVEVLEPLEGRAPEGREAEAASLLEEARFAAWDGNEEADKRALYRRFREARARLAAGRNDEAEPLLRSLDRNPFAARPLAEMLGGRGDCEAAAPYVKLASSRLVLPDGWASEVTRGCALVAGRADDARRLAEWEQEAQGKRRTGTILKGVGAGLWVLGAAAAGVAGWYGWKWSRAQADFDAARDEYQGSADPAVLRAARLRAQDARDRARTDSIVAWASGGAAAVAVAGGVVAWLKGVDVSAEGGAPFPAPLAGPGTVGLSVTGRF